MVYMMSNPLSEESTGFTGTTPLSSEKGRVGAVGGGTIFVTAAARDFCRIDIRPVVYFLLHQRLIVGRKAPAGQCRGLCRDPKNRQQ
jgi:hypothetical protein